MKDRIKALSQRIDGGVLAVPICPFDGRGINDAVASQLIKSIAQSGVDALVPCGNTTEYFSLSPQEAEHFASLTVEASEGKVPIIVGVGGDLRTAASQVEHASHMGIDAVMIHEPVAPYLSNQGLLAYYGTLASATDLAVFPYIRKERFSADEYAQLVSRENVIGVKHATNRLDSLAVLVRSFPDKLWICGSAELWAPFYTLAGARGFTSGLATVNASLSLQLRDQLRAGDHSAAMDTWHRVRAFELLRTRDNGAYNVAVIKEALTLTGIDAGGPRPPASRPPEALVDEVSVILQRWGLLAPTTASGAHERV